MLHREGWADGRDRATLQALFDELDRLVPTGGDEPRGRALSALGGLSPAATDIYVVTDGLPTQSLSSPGLLSGCSKNPTGKVSGECRKLLFAASLRKRGAAGGAQGACHPAARWKATRRRRRRSGTGRRGPAGSC